MSNTEIFLLIGAAFQFLTVLVGGVAVFLTILRGRVETEGRLSRIEVNIEHLMRAQGLPPCDLNARP